MDQLVSRSEYLSVVLSLIVGLSLARILACISSSIPKEPGDRWSLRHSILLTAAFIFQVNYWWNLYDDEQIFNEVTFWGYLAILTVPLLMYTATAVLAPEFSRDFKQEDRKPIDFVDFLDQRRRIFYALVIAVIVMIILQGKFIYGENFADNKVANSIRGGVLLVILLLHPIRVRAIQFLLAFFLLAAMIFYTLLDDQGRIEIPTLLKESAMEQRTEGTNPLAHQIP